MKRLYVNLLKFMPIVILVVMINILIDPARIYRVNYEKTAADIINSGKNIVGMKDYNERKLQKYIILGEKRMPETSIIGSSRVMELSDESTGLSGCMNNGMSGAGIYDYYGILGLYQHYNSNIPDRIVLGLDPWILNINNGDTRYVELQDYIEEFNQEIDNVNNTDSSYFSDYYREQKEYVKSKLQMFSLTYFQSSMKTLIKEPSSIIPSQIDFYGTNEIVVDGGIRYSDGSTEYDKDFRNQSVDTVNENARNYTAGSVYQMEKYENLDIGYIKLLEKMLDYCSRNDVEIIFFLPPFHPYVYNTLSSNPKYSIICEAETLFRIMAKDRDISVFGSYNPSAIGCNENDFLDGMHMRRKCIKKAWRKTQ